MELVLLMQHLYWDVLPNSVDFPASHTVLWILLDKRRITGFVAGTIPYCQTEEIELTRGFMFSANNEAYFRRE